MVCQTRGVLCVFFRKYTCGVLVLCGDIKKLCSVQFILFVLRQFLLYFVDVLDKGCGVINVHSYVGCRVFDMVKCSCSWMTIVEPLSTLFMMMVSSMMSFFRACLCLYVRLSLGFSGICNVMSTSSLMSSTMFFVSVSMSSPLFLLHRMRNDPSD